MVWSPRYPNKCVRYHAATRHAYEEISCVLAHSADSKLNWWLSKTYHPWEFQVASYLQPPQWRTIIWTIVLSGLVMSVGKYLMLVRPAWRIRRMVACWNAVWMCVSFLGFIRLVPVVVHNWSHYPVHDNVCGHADTLWTSGTSGLWATLWVHLKLVEVMVETLLVVLLKQPCGMAEWFNNYAYILIHGNHLLTSQIPAGSAVIMTYYGVSSMVNLYCWYLNTHPSQLLLQPRKSKILFDVAQLVQTFAGVALSVTTLHYWKHAIWNHRHCHAKEEHLRIVAFSWTGGHVLIAALSAVNQQWVQTQAAADAALRKQKRRLRAKAEAAEARNKKNGKRTTKLPPTKTVTFATETEIIIKGKTTKKQPTTATTTSTTRPILVVPAKKKRISTSATSSANALLKQHLVKHRKKILAATSNSGTGTGTGSNGSTITTIPEESESVKDDDEDPIEDDNDKSFPIEEKEEADMSADPSTTEPDHKEVAQADKEEDDDDFADVMEDALDPLAMPSTDSLSPPKPKEPQKDAQDNTTTAAAAAVIAEETCATTNGSQSNSSSTINSSTSNNNGMEGVRRRKKKKKKKKKKRNSNTSLGSMVDNLDYNSSTTSISATNNNGNNNNHNNNDESTSTFDPLFDDPIHGINNNSNHDKDDDDSHWELTVAQRKKQRKRQKKQQQKFQNQQKSDHDQHLKDD